MGKKRDNFTGCLFFLGGVGRGNWGMGRKKIENKEL